MDIDFTQLMPYLFLFVGVISRAIAPYIVKLAFSQEEKMNWEWKYLRGQLALALLAFVLMPLLVPNLADAIERSNWQALWGVGWAAADVGRLLDKVGVELVAEFKSL